MTDQPENPTVFPRMLQHGDKALSEGGITLRDYFAAQAKDAEKLPVSYAESLMGEKFPPSQVPAADHMAWWLTAEAKFRYAFADAMLRERGK